jgi:hypothetical protein
LRSRQNSADAIFAALAQHNLSTTTLKKLRNGELVETISGWLETLPASSSHGSNSTGGWHNGYAISSKETTFASASTDAGASTASDSQTRRERWDIKSGPDNAVVGSAPDYVQPMNDGEATQRNGIQDNQMCGSTPGKNDLRLAVTTLDKSQTKKPSRLWTDVTDDATLVQHTLGLYFSWEYPIFAPLSKEHFLRDFQSGRLTYCSPALVNALLAVGCRFSAHFKVGTSPNAQQTLGDRFFKKAQLLLSSHKVDYSLTTVQALGLMSIREANCGRGVEAVHYSSQSLMLALEMGLHHSRDEGYEADLEVKLATFWGAFSLNKYVLPVIAGNF